MKTTRRLAAALWLICFSLALAAPLQAEPLQAFILAGQSNMEGHAKAENS